MRPPENERLEGEKIQLSLEQGQVAILAIGALVLLGVVFALGVMVGRQLASASLASPQQPPVNDLRALDAAKPPQPAPIPVAPAPGPAASTARPPAPGAARSNSAAAATPSSTPAKPSSPATSPAGAATTTAAASKVPSTEPSATPNAPPSPEELEEDDDSDDAAEAAAANTSANADGANAADANRTATSSKGGSASKDGLPPPPAQLGKYTVQLGSTTSRKDALQLQSQASGQGVKAYVVAAHLGKKGTWYRIRAGGFDTRDVASTYQKEVEGKLHCHSAVMPTKD